MNIKDAISVAGGITAVAKACGITKQAVSQWKRVPPDKCIAFEGAANGLITRYQLRPDVFGLSPDQAA